MLQAQFGFVKVAALGGYIENPGNVTLDTAGWFSGNYQVNKEKYIKRNFGFANWAIRLEHQWAYSIFGMSRVNSVIIGKDSYLFEAGYISARNGADYIGQDRLSEVVKRAKAVQDTLQALGKPFFFVIAPSKADFYSEYLLDEHAKPSGDVLTNYGVLLQKFKDSGVNHLDLNAWFLAMKDTTSVPLYAKTGIHYTTYGAAISAKRIIAEMESRLNKDLPELAWNNIVWSEDLQGSDDDLEKAMNLVCKIPNVKLAYPQITIDGNSKYKPRVIVVGDSFYWQLIHMGVDNQVFSNGQFWYYNKEVYPGAKTFLELNVEEELKNTEAVFIIMTPPTVNAYLEQFVGTFYNFYFDKDNLGTEYDRKIQEKIQAIKDSPEWLAAVQKKAIEQNLPLSKMMYLDAKFVVDQENKSK